MIAICLTYRELTFWSYFNQTFWSYFNQFVNFGLMVGFELATLMNGHWLSRLCPANVTSTRKCGYPTRPTGSLVPSGEGFRLIVKYHSV